MRFTAISMILIFRGVSPTPLFVYICLPFLV